MQAKLQKLVLEYIDEKKDIDENFIYRTLMIAKEHYALNDYIKNMYCLKNPTSNPASYFLDDKMIVANLTQIYKTLIYLENDFLVLKDSRTFKYLYCIHVILHEIEHANQQKIMNKINNIESEILRAEFTPVYLVKEKKLIKRIIEYRKLNKLHKQFYLFSPSERLAEIKSFETSTEIAKSFDDEICYDFMYYSKLDNLLRGYNVGLINDMADVPTKFYLEQFNPNYSYAKIEKMSEGLDSESIIKLGLQSSHDELHKIAQKKLQLSLKLDNCNFN